MDHPDSIRLGAVEKYLLGELPVPQREEFEAHFFDCQDCAAELRMTANFLAIARKELKGGRLTIAASEASKWSWRELFARPAVLAPAFGVLLAVIVFQNGFVLPRINGQVAQLRQPGVVTTVSLIGGNSRGGALPAISGSADQPVLLALDIPAVRPYPSYACVLIDAAGAVVWRVPVSSAQAQDTVSIGVPAGALRAGTYTLLVQGGPQASELARYRFVLSAGH